MLALADVVQERFDDGVLLAALDEGGLVGVIKAGGAVVLILRKAVRLTGAADAAGAAGHDLDKIKVFAPGLDLVDKLLGIEKAVAHRDADRTLADEHACHAHAVHAAKARILNGHRRVFGFVRAAAARDRLRHAAGRAENDAGAGRDAERHVHRFVLKVGEVDAALLDHVDKLDRREHGVHVGLAVVGELLALRLALLRGARHDGNMVYLTAVAVLFVMIAQHGGEHLHRGLAGGNVAEKLGALIFDILDPRRAAGGEHRERAAVFQPVHKLLCLNDRGEIGGERGIEHLGRAHEPERGDHFAHGVFARPQTERFADGDADRRGDLKDDAFILVVQRAPHAADVVIHGDRGGRAHGGALAAADAVGLGELLVKRRHHAKIGAAVREVDDVHALDLLAGAHAVAAENALVRIAHDRGAGGIERELLARVLKPDAAHAEAKRQPPQLARAGLFAHRTVAVVRGEQKLDDHPAVFEQTRRVGLDGEPVARLHGAGGVDAALIVLDDAHTARAVNGEIGVVAQRRHVDARLADDGENVFLPVERDALAVDIHDSLCHIFTPPESRRTCSF